MLTNEERPDPERVIRQNMQPSGRRGKNTTTQNISLNKLLNFLHEIEKAVKKKKKRKKRAFEVKLVFIPSLCLKLWTASL